MARFAHEKLPQLRGNLTQTDLANRLRAKGYGTTQTTVSRWEAGQQPRAYVLPALAAELGVTVDELFAAGDDEEESSSMPLTRDDLLGELYSAIGSALEARERVA